MTGPAAVTADALRRLLTAAAAAGVDPVTVHNASVEIAELQGDILALTRMADPRKLKTAELQTRLVEAHAAMLQAGTERPVEALAVRFGRSKKRIWALLHR
jgi:hypothetical protein